MATVKKIKKAQFGNLCKWSSKRGGGVSCGSGRSARTEEYKPVRLGRRSAKQEEEDDRYSRMERLKVAAKKLPPMSTAPGVRPGESAGEYKKGSQSFFGGDKDPNEARYGKKVAKKSAPKKARVGAKIKSKIKSKKK